MKITIQQPERKTTKVSDLRVGEMFTWVGALYVRAVDVKDKLPKRAVISVTDAEGFALLSEDTEVQRVVDVKVQVE